MTCCQEWLKKSCGTLLWGAAGVLGVFNVYLLANNNTLLAPLIAVIVALISWRQYELAKSVAEISRQQHRTAANKLKLDFFDRRMNLYSPIAQLLAQPSQSDVSLLYKPSVEAEFVFDREIKDWIDQIWNKHSKFHCINKTWERQNRDSEESNKEYMELNNWFIEQLREMPERFSKYLKIEAS